MEASAKDGEGAGRGPCGLRKSVQNECRGRLLADSHDRMQPRTRKRQL